MLLVQCFQVLRSLRALLAAGFSESASGLDMRQGWRLASVEEMVLGVLA